jgi:CPA1 family monovalent cation:H+ antiporter
MQEALHPTVVTLLELLLVIFVVAAVVQRIRLPYTVALVIVGLGLGLVPGLQTIHLTPDLILTVFLPALLFEGAYNVPARRLWQNMIPVFVLAAPGVLLGTVVTAAVVHYVLGLPWIVSLLFGALISSTDPIAVVSMFNALGVPRRLSLIVEGESLFNDGAAIAIFQILLAVAMTGHFSFGAGVLRFVVMVLGALAVGGIIGYGGSRLMHTVDNAQIQITATVVAAYWSYLLADYLTFSGPIATVVTALFFGNYGFRTGVSPRSVHALSSTWAFIGFVANSLVFLLIGLEIDLRAFAGVWEYIAVAFLASLVGRAVVVYGVMPWLRGKQKIPKEYRPVLLWGGLRGAVSLALVLSVPLKLPGGTPFPDRQLLQLIAFGVVGVSLLLQGLTMGPLVHKLGLVSEPGSTNRVESLRGRLQATEGALLALTRQHERGEVSGLEYDRIYSSYERQHNRIARQLEQLGEEPADNE